MVLSSQTECQYLSSHGEDSPSDYTEQNNSVSNTGSAMAERERTLSLGPRSPVWFLERINPKGLRISNKESFYYVDINHHNTGFRFTNWYITVWF